MNYLWHLWELMSWVVIPFTLLATIRLSLQGILKFPGHMIVKILFNEGWCLSIITFIPWHISAFAREQISPFPWHVYSESSAIHGVAEGILAMLIVCIVDMWLLWTPAQMYAYKTRPSEKEKVKFVRIINVLAGLLLLTPNNPVFNLVKSL